MRQGLISVIVPVHNTEVFLEKCIGSILRQTYDNLEVILVDDGSTDSSGRICDSWSRKDNRIRVIHQDCGGVSSARNAALDCARGEYLCFVDSDDYISNKLCETAVGQLEKEKADIVIFNAYKVDTSGKRLGQTEQLRAGVIEKADLLIALMQGRINHYVWNKVYRKNVFENVRFPVGRVWEDVAISHLLIENAQRICCCTEMLYYYLQRSGSIVHNVSAKALEDIFLARYESYMGIKDDYPVAGQAALHILAVAALNLIDRSLWARVNSELLQQAKGVLQENREHILKEMKSASHWLYLKMPAVYVAFRRAKHGAGEAYRGLRNLILAK